MLYCKLYLQHIKNVLVGIDNHVITSYVHDQAPEEKASATIKPSDHDMTKDNERPTPELDDLSKEILRKFTGSSVPKVYPDQAAYKPELPNPHTLSDPVPIKLPVGGVPVLCRRQVDAIRADTRPYRVIARDPNFQVSVTTVMKVKGVGSYAGFNYIPFDERALSGGYEIPWVYNDGGDGSRSKPGRAPSSGRPRLTQYEICQILYDPRSAQLTAKAFGVTRQYVHLCWRKNGLQYLRRGNHTMGNDIIRILEDERPYDEIAKFYQIEVIHVKRIKDGWDDEFPKPSFTIEETRNL